jgi:DNA repair exonuclease SbcCD ATPase subunit
MDIDPEKLDIVELAIRQRNQAEQECDDLRALLKVQQQIAQHLHEQRRKDERELDTARTEIERLRTDINWIQGVGNELAERLEWAARNSSGYAALEGTALRAAQTLRELTHHVPTLPAATKTD